MTYLYLALAIAAETGWALAMKLSGGMRRPGPTVVMAVLYLLSLVFLTLVVNRLRDVGTAYAIWAGAGAALIALAGILWFKEPATAGKLASITLIVIGIVGLRLTGGPA
jgi:multidrug transporter EmrE-like cation transporter